MYCLPNFEPVHGSVSSSNSCFLTCIQISQKVGKVVWYSQPFKNFSTAITTKFQFVVIHTVNGFSIVNKAELDVFLELLHFLWSNGCLQFDLWFLCLVAQMVKHLPKIQETWVWPLGQEDPLEKEMATHSSILAWKIPWTGEPGSLKSTGSQRVGHDWVTSLFLCLF